MSIKRKFNTAVVNESSIITRCKNRKIETSIDRESSVVILTDTEEHWSNIDLLILCEEIDEILSEDEESESDKNSEFIDDLLYLEEGSLAVLDKKRHIDIMHKINSGEYPRDFFETWNQF